MSTLHEDVCTFMKISRQIIIKMRNASDKSHRESQNTHYVFSNFFPESCAVYEIMRKNMVELDRSQMTTKYGAEKMQFACWIPKGDTHTCIIQGLATK